MSERVLIVIDMQNDFIDGALGTKEAVAIVDDVKKKIAEYVARGDELIFTRDTHQEDYMHTNEGKHLPVPHCVEGTEGWQIREGLLPDDYEKLSIIDKPNFGFDAWDSFEFSEDTEFELIGLCTDICLVSNAILLKTFYPENIVKVDPKCCAGVTPESHNAALLTMKMCQVDLV